MENNSSFGTFSELVEYLKEEVENNNGYIEVPLSEMQFEFTHAMRAFIHRSLERLNDVYCVDSVDIHDGVLIASCTYKEYDYDEEDEL